MDVPTTTSGVAATYVSDSAITVTWTDNSSTETGFVIQRSANEGSYSTVSTTDLGITSYSDTSVSSNSQYVYRVAAQNAAGTSAYTTSTAVATTPSAATAPTVTYVSDSSITVGWTDNSSYESGFRIQQSANDGSYSTLTTTATSTVSYADTSTSADSKYIYRAFALNSFATSTAATSSAVYTSSDAPTVGSPTVNSASSISWPWTDNSSYEESFRLDFTTGSGTDVDDVASTSASQTTTGLSVNTQYAVHVHAYRSDRGESTASATSSAVYTLSETPTSPSATGDSTSAITVTWSTSNPSGTNYYVENVTASTNSGWITATSTQFTGLNAGATYTFRVKARNGDSTETSFTDTITGATNSQGGGSSSSGAAGAGGGGGPSGPSGAPLAGTDPTELPKKDKPLDKEELGSFYINDGAKWTNNQNVVLGFSVISVTHVAVADNADMKGAGLVPYVASMKLKLPEGDGKKTLYAQFYNMTKGSKSAVVKSAIFLDSTPPGAPKITNAPLYEDIDEWLKSGQALKGIADPEVKIVLILERTDLTDKIRKKVKELRALRRKQHGLKEEQKATMKKQQEAKKKTGETQKQVTDLLKRVQDLQGKVKALQGNEAAVEAERTRLGQEELKVLGDIKKLEDQQKALEKEDQKGPQKILISEANGGFRTAEEFFREVRIAAVAKTTHKTESNTQGDWSYSFTPGTFNTEGEYAIAANAEDDGGNKSADTKTSFAALENDAKFTVTVPLEEPLEEKEKEVVATSTTEKPEEEKKPEPKTVKQPPVVEKTPVEIAAPIGEPTAPSDGETGATTGVAEDGGGAAASVGGGGGGGVVEEQPPQTVAEVFVAVTETVTEVAQVVVETATIVVQETAKEVAKSVVQTYQVAKAVADNPVVEQVNETVAAPTVAAAAVANVASSASTLPSMLLYLRFLFLQPAMLFGRKKKRAWGIVYNGFTKVPVDLALVRLIVKEKGQVLQSRVTDVAGRYYFLAKQGEYLLEMSKPGFGLV
ncbi:MAG: fibronectin type III domain-containing protein, partial [Patescibacteria group bacterium]